jgi:hypothetical protein
VFVRSASSWSEQAKLVASDGLAVDWFGSAVAVHGDVALVGAPLHDGVPSGDEGAVYVFSRSAGTWSQVQKLTDGLLPPFANFGTSVDLVPDAVVVGVPRDDPHGDDSGSAYAFVRSAGNWTESHKLVPADGAQADRFGESVAAASSYAVVGAFADDDQGDASGSAYVWVGDLVDGEPCVADGECASGLCVDGHCCDTPCGAGDPADCWGCSVATGAAVDGTCEALTGTACDDGLFCTLTDTCQAGVCGAADSPCEGADGDDDCAESCDEEHDSCDGEDPDGSPCDDDDFCNGTDTCLSGICVEHAGNPCPQADGDLDCRESCDPAAQSCTANDEDGSACPGGTCEGGTCMLDEGALCTDDSQCKSGLCTGQVCCRHRDCGLFRCGPYGECPEICTSNWDCIPGYQCLADGQCHPAITERVVVQGCGCTVPGRRQGRLGWWLVALLICVTGRRVRRPQQPHGEPD